MKILFFSLALPLSLSFTNNYKPYSLINIRFAYKFYPLIVADTALSIFYFKTIHSYFLSNYIISKAPVSID